MNGIVDFFMMGGSTGSSVFYGETVKDKNTFLEVDIRDLEEKTTIANNRIVISQYGGSDKRIAIVFPVSYEYKKIYINGFLTTAFNEVISETVILPNGNYQDSIVLVSTFKYNSPIDIEIA